MQKVKLGLLGASALAVASFAVPAIAQDITIASAGPMTGQYAAFGAQLRRGMDFARTEMVADLAETLGRAHAVRTLCNGDTDSTWRNYMLNLMSYVAPGGDRRVTSTTTDRSARHEPPAAGWSLRAQ